MMRQQTSEHRDLQLLGSCLAGSQAEHRGHTSTTKRWDCKLGDQPPDSGCDQVSSRHTQWAGLISPGPGSPHHRCLNLPSMQECRLPGSQPDQIRPGTSTRLTHKAPPTATPTHACTHPVEACQAAHRFARVVHEDCGLAQQHLVTESAAPLPPHSPAAGRQQSPPGGPGHPGP